VVDSKAVKKVGRLGPLEPWEGLRGATRGASGTSPEETRASESLQVLGLDRLSH